MEKKSKWATYTKSEDPWMPPIKDKPEPSYGRFDAMAEDFGQDLRSM